MSVLRMWAIAAVVLTASCVASRLAAEQVLVDMASLAELPNSGDPTLRVSAVETADGKKLRLVSQAGQRAGVTWPGVSVAAPGGSVDLSEYGWIKMEVNYGCCATVYEYYLN